jgi:hypothetical protein
MQQTTLSHSTAAGYATPLANRTIITRDMLQRPSPAASRPVTVADLLSIAMGFDALAHSGEIEPTALETEQLAAVAQIAWSQYHEVGKVLARSVRVLRSRMSSGQYTQLLEAMPGFLI